MKTFYQLIQYVFFREQGLFKESSAFRRLAIDPQQKTRAEALVDKRENEKFWKRGGACMRRLGIGCLAGISKDDIGLITLDVSARDANKS
jgi:hypothetical protein